MSKSTLNGVDPDNALGPPSSIGIGGDNGFSGALYIREVGMLLTTLVLASLWSPTYCQGEKNPSLETSLEVITFSPADENVWISSSSKDAVPLRIVATNHSSGLYVGGLFSPSHT